MQIQFGNYNNQHWQNISSDQLENFIHITNGAGYCSLDTYDLIIITINVYYHACILYQIYVRVNDISDIPIIKSVFSICHIFRMEHFTVSYYDDIHIDCSNTTIDIASWRDYCDHNIF